MCLITDQKEPLIAEEDIIVYKTLKNNLISMFEGFKYELGKLYETNIEEVKTASSGWSCCGFVDQKWLEDFAGGEGLWIRHPDLKCFGEGYHSFYELNADAYYFKTDIKIYKCTVPKGSLYYKNPVGLMISNKLIINEVHEDLSYGQ